MLLIELVVLLAPLVSFCLSCLIKLIMTEKTVINHVNTVNHYGIKKNLVRITFFSPSIYCYLLSPLFIQTGWLWAIGAVMILVPLFMFIIFGKSGEPVPTPDSPLFPKFRDDLIAKWKISCLLGLIIKSLWLASWF